jgi:hypothetical protein
MQLATWYTIDIPITIQTTNEFINGVVGIFSETLTAMWNIPIMRFFLASALLAVIYALIMYLMSSAKSGKL